MELILIGVVIGFIASWIVFRRENWRLEDKIEEKQEQIDNLIRQAVENEIRNGKKQCSSKHSDYFVNW